MPLSDEENSISAPSAGFIEISDSFGDGQFFLGDLASNSLRGYSKSRALPNKSLNNVAACDLSEKERVVTAAKKARSKNSAVKKSSAAKSNVADKPQLIMEFPNKIK
jgi:hypothetical protein